MESTGVHSIAARLSPEMIASLKAFEKVDSFASFLRTLRPSSPEYWPQVYQRLELDYPSESPPPPKPVGTSGENKPWWRFW